MQVQFVEHIGILNEEYRDEWRMDVLPRDREAQVSKLSKNLPRRLRRVHHVAGHGQYNATLMIL